MKRVHNFNPGPSAIPLSVLKRAHEAFYDWQGTGMSVMEVSHRSDAFEQLVADTTSKVRSLLNIPPCYQVLWLPSGARAQYAMVPFNLSQNRTMCFVDTGYWSSMAMGEAARHGKVHRLACGGPLYQHIPAVGSWDMLNAASMAYVHTVDNETVHGVEYSSCPEIRGVPLVSDMTSNIMSRPFDVSQYAMVYASTQKNLGPAGLTLVIVHEDYLDRALPATPTFMRYDTYAKAHSLYNTPPTGVWHMVSLVLEWLIEQGGVVEMAKRNAAKAKRLYGYIDGSDYYHNAVDPAVRSRMNVVFDLPDAAMQPAFLAMAERMHLIGLKGHSAVGGMRVSLYNAVTMASVEALIAMMEVFKGEYPR